MLRGNPELRARTPRPGYIAFRTTASRLNLSTTEALRQAIRMFADHHAQRSPVLEDVASPALPEPIPTQGWLGKEAAEPRRQRQREKRIPNRMLDPGMLREK